jgi:hypothetical protein
VNEEHSASGQKVHSLGLRQFQKACIFKKSPRRTRRLRIFNALIAAKVS